MSGLDWYDFVGCTNVGIIIEGLVLIRLTGKVLFSNSIFFNYGLEFLADTSQCRRQTQHRPPKQCNINKNKVILQMLAIHWVPSLGPVI